MEHLESAVNDFAKEDTPENKMMSLSIQNCTSDMPVPKCDEYSSSNMSSADTTVAYNILSMENKADVDENGSGISNGKELSQMLF